MLGSLYEDPLSLGPYLVPLGNSHVGVWTVACGRVAIQLQNISEKQKSRRGHRVRGSPKLKPKDSNYPIFEVSDPKGQEGYGCCNQKPQISSTWTLLAKVSPNSTVPQAEGFRKLNGSKHLHPNALYCAALLRLALRRYASGSSLRQLTASCREPQLTHQRTWSGSTWWHEGP